MIKIAPSLLSCDFGNLNLEFNKLKLAGIDILHMDVMDGHFVNNITLGPVVLKALVPKNHMVFDVHLMVSEPHKYIKDFVQIGADILTIHYECDSPIKQTLKDIKACDKKAGIAINPETPIESVFDYLHLVDVVLIMTVYPGFGGQKFIEGSQEKIYKLREHIKIFQFKVDIQVDGGINDLTALEVVKNGANILVSGSWFFKHKNYKKAVLKLKNTFGFENNA